MQAGPSRTTLSSPLDELPQSVEHRLINLRGRVDEGGQSGVTVGLEDARREAVREHLLERRLAEGRLVSPCQPILFTTEQTLTVKPVHRRHDGGVGPLPATGHAVTDLASGG